MKNRHVFKEPFKRGAERTCIHCGLRLTYLIELPYYEYYTKDGEYGDTRYELAPECVKKHKSLTN